MEKSKLIEVLFTCDTRERRLFRLWLQSPIHNQRTDVVLLFDHLTQSTALDKQKAWKAIAPAETYDDAKLRQVIFFLSKQLDDFLAWQEIQADASLLELSKLRVFRRRKLEKAFKASLTAAQISLANRPFRNSRYLRDFLLVEQENYNYNSTIKWEAKLNLQETADALDIAYIAEKLRISCLMLSHQAVYRKAEYKQGPLSALLVYIEKEDLLNEPAVAVYYHCYLASVDRSNEDHFLSMLKWITESRHQFPISELRELYLFALNFCIYWINKGSQSYLQYAFDLYKHGFEAEILLENGLVSRFSFFNAVGNAIKIGEYTWAEEFIHKFQGNVEERHRQATVEFNLARIFFERKSYDKAQKLLLNYEYDDLLLNILAKIMLLKIYFEQHDFEPLESLLDSMAVYLKRKESLDENRQNGYKHFIKIMRRIVKAWPIAQKQKQIFTQMIQEAEPLMEREWLLQIVH
jgi:hypothetical protein